MSVNESQYNSRSVAIRTLFVLVAVVLVFKSLQLQVLDDTYAKQAESTAIERLTIYPSRGLIFDRNGELLINNNPVFDLLVTYNQVSSDFDTVKFCQLLGIDKAEFNRRLNKNWNDIRFSKRKPFVFLSTISDTTYAQFQESLYEFPGFFIQTRSVRAYPQSIAAHVLGFIREVDRGEIEGSAGQYVLGDYIGASGLEREYEAELKGAKGARYVLKDNLGRIVEDYQEGRLDSMAQAGKDLYTTLDLELQQYAEDLMVNKIGAVVAIEPKTGEILAMLSKPDYNPNLLTISRKRGQAVQELSLDSLKPFFNRAIMAQYPPGSIFKPMLGAIALEEEVLDANQAIFCPGYYSYNSFVWGCRNHPLTSNISQAIQYSCNAYFFQTFRRIVEKEGFYNPHIGLDTLHNYLHRFGLGEELGIDFPGEETGNVPDAAYYDNIYPKKAGGWKSPTIISLGIGQGELQMTTLQMANMAAVLANRGTYITPHLGKFFKENQQIIPAEQFFAHEVGIKPENFEPIVDGMVAVVNAGTGRSAWLKDIQVAGKTGTVQNPQGVDHSTFIAFAPADDPQIAIAVYVENAGGGGRFAGPIAGLILEKYLKKEIDPSRKFWEKMMLDANLVDKP